MDKQAELKYWQDRTAELINKAIEEFEKESQHNRLLLYNNEDYCQLKGKGIHKKQVEFHTDSHRLKAIFGGNRVGKTVAGAVEAVCHTMGWSKYRELKPSSGWVVSLTNEVQRDVAQREILRWLPKEQIKNIIVRHGKKDDPINAIIDKIILKNGQTIGFKTVEQGRESFQGTSQGWIWFDEEPTQEVFDECKMRIMDTRGDIWFTMTPLKGLTFVYNVVYLNENNDSDVKYWLVEWEDNPWLSLEEINKLVATMTPEEREARQYGRFSSLCGFAFQMKEEVHLKDSIGSIPEWYRKYVTIDYGLDSTAVLWIYVDEQGFARVYREFEQSNLIISEAAKIIAKLTKENIHHYYAPPDLWNRRNDTGKSAADIFIEHGIRLTKTSNDRVKGWMNVREWLLPVELRDEQTGDKYKTAYLTFDKGSCPKLWKCMNNIQKSDKDPDDVAKEPHNITHLPDSLRCFCVHRPRRSAEPSAPLKGEWLYTELKLKGYKEHEIDRLEKSGVRVIGKCQ